MVRPLIQVKKEEILKYNKKNKNKYALDSSNFKDVYTRNRFRKYIVPQLKKEDINVHKKFYKFSKTLLEYNEFIDKIVNSKIKEIYPNNVLNIEKFRNEDKIIQQKVIYHILENT